MTPSLPRPRAVLFDWDGTLVDNWGVIHAALGATLEAWGMRAWTLEETMQRVSGSQRDSFPTLFGETWREARDHFFGRFEAEHLARLVVLDGAENVLDLVAAQGLWQGVVSNKTGRYLRLEAEHLGWTPRFGALVGATDAAADKPSPEPVLLALERSGGIPADPEVWFIGDSATDVATARNAGCTAVLVRQPGANPAPLPPGIEADATIGGLDHLALLLESRLR